MQVARKTPAEAVAHIRELRQREYDAAYLELAIRKGLPLATLDEDLQKAARSAGGERLQPG